MAFAEMGKTFVSPPQWKKSGSANADHNYLKCFRKENCFTT